MFRYRKNQVNVGVGLIIILLLLIGGGTIGGIALSKKLSTTQAFDAAITAYQGVLTAANVYVTACAEKTIPQTCVPTAQQVVKDVDATKAAYNAVKPYGTNPPATLAQALADSVSALQAIVPSAST